MKLLLSLISRVPKKNSKEHISRSKVGNLAVVMLIALKLTTASKIYVWLKLFSSPVESIL
jgi:hypothetical protein